MNENEMKSLERRLRSWQPRRPSPTLKWRLFMSPARLAAQTARLVGWLAPVAACAWLAFLSLDSGSAISARGPAVPLTAMISSNQSYMIYEPEFVERGRNAPLPAILKWTNAGNSSSINSFTPFRKTTD